MCGETLDNKPPSQFYSEGLASDTLVGVVAAISRDLLEVKNIQPRSSEWCRLGSSQDFGIQHLATRPSLGQERFCGWTTMEAWNNLT